MIIVVVPFPFFHVILSVSVPFAWPGCTEVSDVPPAASAVGVHDANVALIFPPVFASGCDVTFAHATCGGIAAEADTASGTTRLAPAATATASALPRIESFTDSPPGRNDLSCTAEDS